MLSAAWPHSMAVSPAASRGSKRPRAFRAMRAATSATERKPPRTTRTPTSRRRPARRARVQCAAGGHECDGAEAAEDDEDADEPEFFDDHREDHVGVRFRQEVDLLHAVT